MEAMMSNELITHSCASIADYRYRTLDSMAFKILRNMLSLPWPHCLKRPWTTCESTSNGIVFSLKEGGSSDTCYVIDEDTILSQAGQSQQDKCCALLPTHLRQKTEWQLPGRREGEELLKGHILSFPQWGETWWRMMTRTAHHQCMDTSELCTLNS